MEEEKAAAYYDELTRKGGGAARFKQGLGFSASSATTSDDPPTRGSALPSSTSSFLSNFVRASSPSKTKELEKQAQLQSIQNKLKKKEPTTSIDEDASSDRVRVRVRDRDRRSPRIRSRSRSRDRDRDRDRHSRRSRSRSRSRERRRRKSRSRSRERKRDRDRRRRRSRSESSSDGERRHKRERGRSRSLSPRDRRSEKGRDGERRGRKVVRKDGDGPVDYAKLIDGYDNLTPAERVKAKMKLQLSQTAEKDAKIGAGTAWERFEFDKDAPVDDEEIEATDDDAAVVKHINHTFRFASLESKREDEIRAAHDEAMFGAPAAPSESDTSESEGTSVNENKENHVDDVDPASSLLNEKVLVKQQGSWRDRTRRNVG
uniref:RNA helicase n=1 Tax=Opuntia streptacantha TaxID=393608 RepID=A0A7C9EWB8_OPUST